MAFKQNQYKPLIHGTKEQKHIGDGQGRQEKDRS